MRTIFISDLHLSGQRPEKLQTFQALLSRAAGRVEALYILGDLFEVWVGDDDDTPPNPEILNAMREFSGRGTPLYVMHGNRDFFMGGAFAGKTGCTLLADPHAADLYGTRVLLMHGDLLCSQDTDYQAFRQKVRAPPWQQRFLSRPLWVRKAIGHYARWRSRHASRRKADYIIDVDQASVEAAMRAHGVRLLIHGHTHRPAIHDFDLDGEPARRIVLGDWYVRDSVLVCDAASQRLMPVGEFLAGPD
ncbi:MAG: UDP-2,3-diacylglucosamine hydrolase [Gammaproteobacteria bacterium]|nr:UDP-2,3-diacylglucosamine hydrolase [Gammaproteobacteria bacterium]